MPYEQLVHWGYRGEAAGGTFGWLGNCFGELCTIRVHSPVAACGQATSMAALLRRKPAAACHPMWQVQAAVGIVTLQTANVLQTGRRTYVLFPSTTMRPSKRARCTPRKRCRPPLRSLGR